MIIGITGKAHAGKDTAADIICAEFPVARAAFAHNLKLACQIIFGFSHDQLWGHLKETFDPRWGFTPREALQRVGQIMRLHFSSFVWIDSLSSGMRFESVQRYVITDVRHDNEAKWVRDRGIIIKIQRAAEGARHGADHISEAGIDEIHIDHVIDNDGTLNDLANTIIPIIENELGMKALRNQQDDDGCPQVGNAGRHSEDFYDDGDCAFCGRKGVENGE